MCDVKPTDSLEIEKAERAYATPVSDLLRLGDPRELKREVSCKAFCIGRAQIPDLIRMATDDALHTASSVTPLIWAPLHAWCLLGELRATDAIAPLIGLLRRIDEADDDWVCAEIPDVLIQIGTASLSPLIAFMNDPANGLHARNEAAITVGKFGQAHPQMRDTCVAALQTQLAQFAQQLKEFNAFLIWALIDLQSVDALPVIERAFAAGSVEESIVGDREDMLINFGLIAERSTPRKPNKITELGDAIRDAFAKHMTKLPDCQPVQRHGGQALPLPPLREKPGRNDPCPCGSGRKFKKCCL